MDDSMREITIDRLGREGDGFAGRIRAAFTLPGERVRGPVAAGRMAPVEILAPSPERVAPVCRHFGACGGCALQHGSDAFLAGWKEGTIARALAAQGLAAEIRPVLTSPPRSRRRAVFAGRRTRKGAVVGFHGRRSEELVAVSECHLVRPAILAVLPALAVLTRAAASRLGEVRFTVTEGPAGLDIDGAGGRRPSGEAVADFLGHADAADVARLAWEGEPLAHRRPPLQPMGAAHVVPPPGAFLQATQEGAAALVDAVRDCLGPARRVADLFAGCGTFALPLAETAEVHAVEAEPAMLAALDAGWRGAPGLRRVSTEARDLFRRPLLPAELARFDGVAFDPPRAGAEAQAQALATSGVPRIAAVSCNPASFARDAAILVAGGYSLDWVRPVDQFRWSGHVELAAQFTRSRP
ncbi:class I SAM-dependent RNA methyltransferase [Amaricoccus sp.]|uniref:class I SAM-dependent RNA methyltransferase n=1 Tax=Amaricoccus sp. TaxID=1872485 RepID=UPI002C3004F2|nr:class I SAM-dependent RNA methyltransferase [Amaricoccus sp.]HRW14225.1 class I SAM-dependent RNA methyltransferase [Amaricoccus sp.]